MRTIATMLLVLMAAIYLAMRRAPAIGSGRPISPRSRKRAWWGPAPTGSRWSRFFAVPSGCRFPIPRSFRRTSGASGRRWGASSPTTFSALASPSRGSRRSTLSVSRRDGSRTSATRGRLRPPPDAPFRTRSTSCRKGRSTNGSLSPRGAGSRRSPRRRSPRAGLSILWAQGAGQTLLDQGLDFVETTLDRHKATIVKHVSQRTWRWIPKWVDDMIAAKVVNGLSDTLKEMRDPDHPWREQANALVEKLIDDLAHDPEMRAQGEALKQEILANPVFAEQARALWEELETALRDDLPRHARGNCPVARGLGRRDRPVARRGRSLAERGSTGG